MLSLVADIHLYQIKNQTFTRTRKRLGFCSFSFVVPGCSLLSASGQLSGEEHYSRMFTSGRRSPSGERAWPHCCVKYSKWHCSELPGLFIVGLIMNVLALKGSVFSKGGGLANKILSSDSGREMPVPLGRLEKS